MVFFEDEASFGRMNHVRKCWVHRPDRAIVKKQAIREYIYAFTVVCPQTGETCSIISPFCNTEAMNALLSETSIAYSHYRIIMIMDSAGWHTTKNIILPENICHSCAATILTRAQSYGTHLGLYQGTERV